MTLLAFSFDLNLAQLLSPLVVACVFVIVRGAKNAVMQHIDNKAAVVEVRLLERLKEEVQYKKDTATILTSIQEQTTMINGAVLELKEQDIALHVAVARLEGAVFRERGLTPEGTP